MTTWTVTRELKLLRHLGGHENISWILDIMVSPNRRNFRDVCVARMGRARVFARVLPGSPLQRRSPRTPFVCLGT